MNEDKEMSGVEVAIVVSHTMRRFLLNFKPHERTNAIDIALRRIKRFLCKREVVNFKEFYNATEFEKTMYLKVTDSYDKATPVFAIDVTIGIYDYYEQQLKKYVELNPKIMEKISMIMNNTSFDSKASFELEANGGSLLDTYVKTFEKNSGVALRKSLFAGKKLTIKNNMIIDGKEVAAGF